MDMAVNPLIDRYLLVNLPLSFPSDAIFDKMSRIFVLLRRDVGLCRPLYVYEQCPPEDEAHTGSIDS